MTTFIIFTEAAFFRNLSSMHEYTAPFRVSGEQLVIAEVTRTLQIQPTHVVQLGESQQGGPAKKAMWSFERVPPSGGLWHSLEDALTTLVSELRQRHEEIRTLQAKFDVYLWCGHFTPVSAEDPNSHRICCEFLATLAWTCSWTRTFRPRQAEKKNSLMPPLLVA